jgi:hypothetical protein
MALLGCVDPGKGARWPGHRKDHDARLDKLANQLDAETAQIAVLSKRLAELEQRLSPPAPTPSAPDAASPDTSK